MKTPEPLRIVLATVGSRGDVQPMLALALELQARGHHPVLAAPPDFAAWAQSLGIAFAPLGFDIQQFLSGHPTMLSGHPRRMLSGFAEFMRGQLPMQLSQLAAACHGADALLWTGLAFAAPTVAEQLGLPTMGILYTTSVVPSERHPPPTIARQTLPHWLNHLLWHVNRVVVQHLLGQPLNERRLALGLTRVSLHQHFFSDGQYLLAADPVLFPPDPTWGERVRAANFIFFEDACELDGELLAWLDAGEAPIYVGFGSMSGDGIDRVGRMVVEAVSATGLRCIVGAGWAGLGNGALPEGWRVVREAPHHKLFPRMAAVIHHGGSGTTATALRAGIPQVILPLILDQYHNAHRLHVAGLVPRPIAMEKITPAELTQSIRTALALAAQPRQLAAQRLRDSNGCGDIVDRVEALVIGRRRSG